MCDGKRVTESHAAQSCGCGGHADAVGKTVDTATELILPAVQFPSRRLLENVGEAKLREVVERHHALLASGPIGAMFPGDPEVFAALVKKVADFVVETCGGAASYTSEHGHVCMRTRHFPFTIDEQSREVWLEALFRAMDDVVFPAEAREEYWNWLEAFSVRMINRRTIKAQPVRIPFVVALLRFGNAAPEGLPCGARMRFCPRG
jgi:hemoglobin